MPFELNNIYILYWVGRGFFLCCQYFFCFFTTQYCNNFTSESDATWDKCRSLLNL